MSDHFDQNMHFKTLPLDFRPFTPMPYTDYGWEGLLAQGPTLALVVPRKVNAKRSMSSVPRSLCHYIRKRVATSFQSNYGFVRPYAPRGDEPLLRTQDLSGLAHFCSLTTASNSG
jgi:hypothetical protein